MAVGGHRSGADYGPDMLVANELASMLGSSSKANLIRLLKEIQNVSSFFMLIVTHNLAC